MVRLPRVRGSLSQAEMDRIVDALLNPDWLEWSLFFGRVERNPMRLAVRSALRRWSA